MKPSSLSTQTAINENIIIFNLKAPPNRRPYKKYNIGRVKCVQL